MTSPAGRIVNAYLAQWLLLGFVLVSLGAMMGLNLYRERQHVETDERNSLLTQVRVINDNLSEELRATNAALQELITDHAFWKTPGGWRDSVTIHLQSLADAMPGIRTFVYIDAQGVIRASNRKELIGLDVSQREYFTEVKETQEKDRLYISKPFKSVLNVHIMGASKMMPGPNGEFLGVVNASLDPGYFKTLLGSVNYAPDMWTAVAHGEGIQFVMMPEREGMAGLNLAKPGSFFSRHMDSGRDENFMTGTVYATGESRMMALRSVRPSGISMTPPLVVAVGRDLDAVFKDWLYHARRQTLLFLAIAASSIAALVLYHRRSRQFERQRMENQAALRQSLNDFNDLVARIPVGVYKYRMLADGGHRFEFVSPRWCHLIDLDADEVYRDPELPFKRIHPEDAQDFIKQNEAARSSLGIFVWEGRIVRSDGEVRWLHIESHPSQLANGDILWNGIQYDITERQSLDDDLKRSNAELEQFAYVASHDLREPLRMVNSFVSLLDRRYSDKLDDQAREFIAFARDGAMRMDRLICDLLEYSRIGRKGKPFAQVDMNEAIGEAVLNLKALNDSLDGEIEIAPDLPSIPGDHDELVRLFQNLIGNALKYHAPDRKPLVRLSASKLRSHWIVKVEDNGIGIAKEHLERIFGIFQRLHSHQEYEGTGIGLAICKKICDRHKGRIWAESVPGQGCTFYVSLPGERFSPSSPSAHGPDESQ
ncbi:MAG: hypothetical protein EPN26_11115 [Rhodospirillales bacterium]|nr:MAG: hypothetical protein EPN26_11115 [Rhodospirillales bacterium]